MGPVLFLPLYVCSLVAEVYGYLDVKQPLGPEHPRVGCLQILCWALGRLW